MTLEQHDAGTRIIADCADGHGWVLRAAKIWGLEIIAFHFGILGKPDDY